MIPVLLLELLFLRLGVYFHRSWTFWHSIGAFLAYGLAAAYGAGSFERKGYTPRHRLILIAAAVYYAMNLWGLLSSGTLRLASMRLHMVESAELDHILSSLLLAPWSVWLEGLCFSLSMAGFAWVDRWFAAHRSRKIQPWEPPAALRPKARS